MHDGEGSGEDKASKLRAIHLTWGCGGSPAGEEGGDGRGLTEEGICAERCGKAARVVVAGGSSCAGGREMEVVVTAAALSFPLLSSPLLSGAGSLHLDLVLFLLPSSSLPFDKLGQNRPGGRSPVSTGGAT